jgi:hypothetical protein
MGETRILIKVVTDVFCTERGIRLSFVKTSEFRGSLNPPKSPPLYDTVTNRRFWHSSFGLYLSRKTTRRHLPEEFNIYSHRCVDPCGNSVTVELLTANSRRWLPGWTLVNLYEQQCYTDLIFSCFTAGVFK